MLKSDYLNFVMVNIVMGTVFLISIALLPVLIISLDDPILQRVNNSRTSYHVECYTFAARAIGWNGSTVCTDYTPVESCFNIIRDVNLDRCSLTQTAHVSTAPEFYTSAYTAGLCMWLITFLVVAILVTEVAALLFTDHWVLCLNIASFLGLMLGLVALVLLYGVIHSIDQAKYTGNNNAGQDATPGFSFLVGTLFAPILMLLSINVLGGFNTST